ncbi:VWA domain-containing protein [Streptomyces sp. URMC 129]|uniref:VWA domain-containing protein n=1 Tax=Streptomyces sp. URMC 129 TaxID=3423407 RepID=UPI003F1C4FBF
MTDRRHQDPAPAAPAITLVASPVQELAVDAVGDGVHVLLDVRTRGVDRAALGAGPAVAEVIIVDCSGSMGLPGTKIAAAQDAADAAVDALREGTAFAVVQGTHRAEMIYPAEERLATADHDTRAQAKSRIRHLFPGGGTTIGTWLALARRLLTDTDADVRHAVLLTDGRNVADAELLEAELDACEGLFMCDTRGVGEDWDARELKQIADRLHGTASAVLDDSDLPAAFEAMVRRSMARTLAGLVLRITLVPGSRIRYFKQVHPVQRDLTGEARPAGGRSVEFPTPAWAGDEVRQYHLCLDTDPPEGEVPGEEVQLAYAEVVPGTARVPAPPPVPVLVVWRPGDRPPTEPNPVSTWSLRYDDLAEALAEAYEAFRTGDPVAAEARLGDAARAAHELGDERWLRRLAAVVTILDAAAGRVALRQPLDPREMGILLMDSDVTSVATGLEPGDRADPVDPHRAGPEPDGAEDRGTVPPARRRPRRGTDSGTPGAPGDAAAAPA